ncbi:MAG: hypothetical protein MJE12_30220 [Alphaproteobacteria bacterium]|nr:hypothetical protein [Alphaproteobacteria bacterium]
MKALKTACAVALLGVVSWVAPVADVEAKEVRIVIGVAGDGALQQGMDQFANRVEAKTEGAYTGRVFKGSLLSYAETPPGLANGVAEVGYMVPAYVRGEYPLTNFATDITATIVEPVAVGAAMSEFIFTCEPCLEEFKRQNQVFTGFAVVGPYRLMTATEVSDPSDIEGMRIRGFGAFNELIGSWDAIEVSLSANEVYEAFSSGQLDANIHLWDMINTLSLGGHVNYMYDRPIGIYGGNAMFNMNLDFWKGLSDEDKRHFLSAAAEALAWTTVTYFANEEALSQRGDELKVTAMETPDTLRQSIETFQEANIQRVIDRVAEAGNIEDARGQGERLLALVEKWRGLVAGIDATDPDAVAALYKSELYDSVDLQSLQ